MILLNENEYLNFRKNNFKEFQYMNIFSNLKREKNILNNNPLIFLDRWVFDWIASLKRESIKIEDFIETLVKGINYDHIFIIEALEKHETREKTWRVLNKDTSEKWNNFIIKEYIERFWKDKVSFVPFDTIENRSNFILDKIKYLK